MIRPSKPPECAHKYDVRDTFSHSKNQTVYWCGDCGKSLEYIRHPVTGKLLEVRAT